mmetsp:Transcript_27316/g.48323  ORF Transcript_27316/g.48323 Transcript_27316/m.48323 type:complete len:540 (-) Transcript_27316:669-2288(-)
MGRFKPDDFGYDFASREEETVSLVLDKTKNEGSEKKTQTKDGAADATRIKSPPTTAAAASGDVATSGAYKLYEEQSQKETDGDYKYQPAKFYRGGESFVVSDDALGGMSVNGLECLGAICCCFTAALVTAGGIIIAYEQYKGELSLFVGVILLVLAAGTCLCSCCALCIGTSTDGFDLGSGSGDSKADPNHREVKVRLRRLNDRYEKGCMKAEDTLGRVRLDVVGHIKEVKEAASKEAKEKKESEKKNREELEKRVKKDIEAGIPVKTIRQKYRPVTFYVEFHGDPFVSKLELLRKQVSLVVNLGRPGHDQCVVAITSPGGGVSQYGLAASQLVRIRKAGIQLIVCVDSIAASGGYMMASVADKICAAPFAVVGSIGVVTHIPNVQRFLNEHKIDAYLMTAGNYKRTIDVIGEVTEEGKAKLTEQLDDIHIAFKDHVALSRPKLREKIEEVGTGEHWLAVQAKEKGLVDEIMTSDEYLESISEDYDIIEILEKQQRRSGMMRVLGDNMNAAVSRINAVIDNLRSTAEAPGMSPTPMAIV